MICAKLNLAFGLLGAMALSACVEQRIPDSGQGVGYSPTFSQFEIDRARREAQLAAAPGGAPLAAATPPGGIPTSQLAAAGIGASPVTTQPLGAGTIGAQPVSGNDPLRTAGVQATPGNAAPVVIASTGISDEQDFAAVATRESIESDAARREQQQAAYQVIAPEALPQRTDIGPNIVQYALAAPNRRGQEWYSRSVLTTQARYTRNCAAYRSPDDAQRDFLTRGGPDRDSAGIDPDGDGFACGWDPAPFLAAVGRN